MAFEELAKGQSIALAGSTTPSVPAATAPVTPETPVDSNVKSDPVVKGEVKK